MPDTVRTLAIKGPEDFAAQFPVSRETLARLETYAALLPQWQKAVNLVARSTIDNLWDRHIADSAQLLKLAPDAQTWLDIGSGAGFPGLVIAILRAQHGQGGVTLIESDRRKCAFMKEVCRQTGIAVDIVEERIESSATHDRVGSADIVSARALASLSQLIELSSPYRHSNSICLFMKGQAVAAELKEAAQHWSFRCDLVSSITDTSARIAVMKRIEAKVEG